MMTPDSTVSDVRSVDFSQSMKQGESCANWYLFFGPFGDASIVQAAKNAGIKKVEAIYYKYGWYLLMSQRCAVVYGQ